MLTMKLYIYGRKTLINSLIEYATEIRAGRVKEFLLHTVQVSKLHPHELYGKIVPMLVIKYTDSYTLGCDKFTV